MSIGIDNANAKWINDRFYNKKIKACYAYSTYAGGLYAWNIKSLYLIKEMKHPNGILTMKLVFNKNKDNGTLSFKIDSGHEFIPFINKIVREKSLEYRLAISMSSANLGIELIEFDSYPTVVV